MELYGSTLNKKVGIFELLRVEENISIFLWCWMWNRFFENPILRYFKIRNVDLQIDLEPYGSKLELYSSKLELHSSIMEPYVSKISIDSV